MKSAVVHIVDDDLQLRTATSRLLRSFEFRVLTYDSANDFLSRAPEPGPGCIVLDLAMPEMDGLELQQLVTARHNCLPIVFISGHGNVPSSVKAMKAGAVDFLTKPFEDQALVQAVRSALERSHQLLLAQQSIQKDWTTFKSLTDRQRQVCLRVAQGLLNKQIGGELNLAEGTVKLHRSFVMKKLRVSSAADLVKLVQRLQDAGKIT